MEKSRWGPSSSRTHPAPFKYHPYSSRKYCENDICDFIRVQCGGVVVSHAFQRNMHYNCYMCVFLCCLAVKKSLVCDAPTSNFDRFCVVIVQTTAVILSTIKLLCKLQVRRIRRRTSVCVQDGPKICHTFCSTPNNFKY